MDEKTIRQTGKLPPKEGHGGAYSLAEIMACADEDMQHLYGQSYRVKLAMQRLQEEVEKSVRDRPQESPLLPTTPQEARENQQRLAASRELWRNLSKVKTQVVKSQLRSYLGALRAAAEDPLRMAYKQVVDCLAEEYTQQRRFDLGYLTERVVGLDDHRESFAFNTAQMMMLMADNAVNHAPHQLASAMR